MIQSRSIAGRIADEDIREAMNGARHPRLRMRRLLRRGGLALNDTEGAPRVQQDIAPSPTPAEDPLGPPRPS